MHTLRKCSLSAGVGTAVSLYPVVRRQGEARAALPIAVWEFSLGVYRTFHGFREGPVLASP